VVSVEPEGVVVLQERDKAEEALNPLDAAIIVAGDSVVTLNLFVRNAPEAEAARSVAAIAIDCPDGEQREVKFWERMIDAALAATIIDSGSGLSMGFESAAASLLFARCKIVSARAKKSIPEVGVGRSDNGRMAAPLPPQLSTATTHKTTLPPASALYGDIRVVRDGRFDGDAKGSE